MRRLQTCTAVFAVVVLCVTTTIASAIFSLADPISKTAPLNPKSYSIEDMGELPHIADDVLAPLNSNGQVACWMRNAQNIHASVWQHDRMVDLGTKQGYPTSIAHAINTRGAVAGWVNTSNNPVDSQATTRGFILENKHFRVLSTLGGQDSRVLGLNDRGRAVGEADLAKGQRHAFLTNGSALIDLGTLPAGTFSEAYAISNTDIVAGVADIDGRHKHAVAWTDGKIADLGTLPGGVDSCARSVNDKGQIVGFSEMPQGYHAFLYSDETMHDLGTLGSDPSMASGINNAGDVVGTSGVAGYGHHAFLWKKDQMLDLNTLIPQNCGWILTNAFSINDRGQITCSGFRKGESAHLILLTP